MHKKQSKGGKKSLSILKIGYVTAPQCKIGEYLPNSATLGEIKRESLKSTYALFTRKHKSTGGEVLDKRKNEASFVSSSHLGFLLLNKLYDYDLYNMNGPIVTE